ncbi:MAG: extracellular solute-binding protein [Phycisphaerales bacterium]
MRLPTGMLQTSAFRLAALFCAALAALVAPSACSRDDSAQTVVLYSSVDDAVARPLIAAFEKRTGLRVVLVGDTEATKTTGLVQRLLAEKDAPRADVWWSSEALGTAKLSNAGIFAPYSSKPNEGDFEGGWPRPLRGIDGDWYGFALRPRVFVYHTQRVVPADVPRTLVDLTRPRFKSRVGIASPQFGTTRGHFAALRTLAGESPFDAWYAALKDNGVRLYDGNASVVRAVHLGEIDVGLTDHDDVLAGQANQWPVAAAYEAAGVQATPDELQRFGPIAGGMGTLMIPNTVALVRGARHLQNACRLIDFLLSPEVERDLARSSSGNVPVRPALATEFPNLAVPAPLVIDWEEVINP